MLCYYARALTSPRWFFPSYFRENPPSLPSLSLARSTLPLGLHRLDARYAASRDHAAARSPQPGSGRAMRLAQAHAQGRAPCPRRVRLGR
eukprot:scaffold169397_cov30-Tisochrysis_lutea.AAC.2